MNPWDGVAHFFLGLIEQKKIQGWYTLIFQLVFSSLVTFLYVTGSALAAGTNALISVGLGMVSAALVLTVLFKRSPMTKGMLAIIPAEEMIKENTTNLQVIDKQ